MKEGFEIDKGRTPPPILTYSQDETRKWGHVRRGTVILEVVLVARDSCSTKSSGISRKPLALAEGCCTLHVSPRPLASELEDVILGSICWTRCFMLLPNPDTRHAGMVCCIVLRWLSKQLWLSSDFPLEILQEMTLYTQCIYMFAFSCLPFRFLAGSFFASCTRSNQSCNWFVSSLQGQRISRVEVQVERPVAQRSLNG